MIVCVCVWRWGSYTGSFFFRNATSGRSQSCQTWFINGLKWNSTNFRHRRLLQVIGTSAAYTKRSCSSGYRGKSDKCPWVSLVSVWRLQVSANDYFRQPVWLRVVALSMCLCSYCSRVLYCTIFGGIALSCFGKNFLVISMSIRPLGIQFLENAVQWKRMMNHALKKF